MLASYPALAAQEASDNIAWYYVGSDGLLKSAAGRTFKVPANITSGTSIVAVWNNSDRTNGVFENITPGDFENVYDGETNSDNTLFAVNADGKKINYNGTAITTKVDAYLVPEAPTFVFTNGQATTSSTYKTYDAPQVGCTIIASCATPGVAYAWNGANAATANDKEYVVVKEDVGKELKCTVTAPDDTTYKAGEASASTDKVAISTRTIDKLLVSEDATINTPAKFRKASMVTKLNVGTQYYVYALDSEGNLLTQHALFDADGVVYSWYDELKSLWHETNSDDGMRVNGPFKAKQRIVLDIIPDGLYYVGDPAEYTFKTAVGAPGEGPADMAVTKMGYGDGPFVADGTAYSPEFYNSTGEEVTADPTDYIWTVTKPDGAAATGVTLDIESGNIKSTAAGSFIVTATPTNSAMETLRTAITFVN